MFHTSIIATAFLATIAIAMPSRVLDDRSHPRDDTATMCAAGDTSTTDGVQALLDNTGAIDWLDIMLSTFPDGEGGWVDKLWTTVFIDQGASPLSGCGNIGSDCTIDTLCQDYSTPMAYWTLKSVQMLHSKINTIHSMLLWDGWLAGLSIDQIAEDFSSVDPSSEWAKWISAAFTMAGGFATGIDLSKPLRGMVGFASGALSEVGNTSGNSDNVDTTSVENTLKNIVGSAGNYLASILQNATGNGDSTTLPIYTLSTLQYGTSRFLSDNTILLDENSDNSTFMSAYDSYGKNVQQMLVDVALKTAWYVLLEDEDVAQSDCTFTGSLWLQGASEEHCFYITRPTTTKDCTNNDPSSCWGDQWLSPYNTPNRMDDSVYTKLTDTYGFDLDAYYTSLIDCAVNGNGEVDLTATTNNGQIPRCFFNGYVSRGTWLREDSSGFLMLYFYDDLY